MSEDNILNFEEIFEGYEKEIPVIIHNFPDPDAISSAMAATQLLKMAGLKPGKIYYSGEISHPQNKSMMTLLNIDAINYEEEPFEVGSEVIIVDTNNIGPESNQSSITAEDAVVKVVIDHHKGKNPRGASVDCRFVGATASIMWDYLVKTGFDFDTDEGKTLATALIVGITTDTSSLTSDTIADLDFDAYRELIKKVNKQKLISIMEYPLPPYLFDLRQRAFMDENKTIEESTIVSGIGIISQSKRDALPIIADEFLRMTGIMTSVVFAIIEDYIDISVRSKNITIDVGDFVQKVFGTGGGKQGAGRARIPLGFFSMNGDKETNEDTWELAKRLVFSKVLSNVKGE